MSFAEALAMVEADDRLSEAMMERAMGDIMDGTVDEARLAKFLTILARRGETVAEITGAARVLRHRVTPISAPPGAVDCCGTGGDGLETYNISTAVALVAASCGVPVAKHGNRAASSRSGAADVLEQLGVNLDAPQERLSQALHSLNFAFLMAPRHHSAMRHVASVRKKLKFRTIFNLLGPLANPAGTRRQLIGVYDRKWVRPIAEVLQNLGSEAAWVVHGRDGMDEISLSGPTDISTLKAGAVDDSVVTPEQFGLSPAPLTAIKGGTPADNAAALRALLSGALSAYRDIVVANCAAVLMIAEKSPDLANAADRAAHAIDSGEARALLQAYVEMTQS